MTQEALGRLVALGEGRFVEFKTRVPEPHRIAKEAVAFANSDGGSILIGVEDDGTIKGVKDSTEEVFALTTALESHCDPPISIQIKYVAVTRKRDVIVAKVRSSETKPHYVVHEDARVAYVRAADQSIEASREAVRVMRQGIGESVQFEFGDKELMLMRYLDQYGKITVEDFARLAAIKRKQASQTLVILTRAEVLSIHPSEKGDYFMIAPKQARGAA